MTNFTLTGIETVGKSVVTTDSGLTTITLPASGTVNAAVVDCKDYQSVTVQTLGTWVGTLAFEVSNDGTNWVAKTLVTSAAVTTASSASNNIYFGDIGARYFRARFTAWTSGTATVITVFNAFSYAPPLNTVSVSNSPTLANSNLDTTITTTNLGVSATFAQTGVDTGATVSLRPTRIRPVVLHTAGLTPGILVLEESTDNTTWRETRRVPVPSDSSYRSFDWPLHMRYYRVRFINGATAQTAFYLQALTTHGEGPSADSNNTITFPMTATALGVSASFTSPALDLGANHCWRRLTAIARADQVSAAGGFRIDLSNDGTNWYPDPEATATLAVNSVSKISASIVARYVRVTLVNSTTAQTALFINATLTDS